jgi:hypothetical protein
MSILPSVDFGLLALNLALGLQTGYNWHTILMQSLCQHGRKAKRN